MMFVSHVFIQVATASAGGAANEGSFTTASQASDQAAACGSANDRGMLFPPILIVVPVYIVDVCGLLRTGCRNPLNGRSDC